MVHIPPMGQKKKTQQGRPRGRNELISEWIYQETGVRRGRKQVSSHIQVLGKIFAGVAECKASLDWTILPPLTPIGNALTVPAAGADDHDSYNSDFYNESIADQVRIQRQLMVQADAGDSADQFPWNDLCSQRQSLVKLNFDMWVGLPEKVTQALHNYTRLERNQEAGPSAPLESFKNWRTSFPDLEDRLPTLEDQPFDIILIKSSFELMNDFPPQTAKLGLVLDLDFRNPTRENYRSLSAMKCWQSTNHMYHNGQLVRKTGLRECQGSSVGIVQPFFEAEWWATQFTKLTHRKKEAEDSGDGTALTAADEYSRSLFRGLTMMQEILASPSPGSASPLRRRMAVLLWVFSQATKGHLGVTSWQKLVPPPSRLSTNSPSPQAMESLPPLVLDSMVGNSFSTDTTLDPLSQSIDSFENCPVSPPSYEVGEYYSGFTPFQNMSSEQLRMLDFSLENESTGFTPKFSTHDQIQIKTEPFDFSAPILSNNSIPYLHPTTTTNHEPYSSIFTTIDQHNGLGNQHQHENLPYQIPSSTSLHQPTDRRQLIANFDLSTHRLLQAQLEDYDIDSTCNHPQSQHQPLQQPQPQPEAMALTITTLPQESQSSMIHHMHDLDLHSTHLSQALLNNNNDDSLLHNNSNPSHTNTTQLNITTISTTAAAAAAARQHPIIFDSPKLTRPPLMTHHSFAGVLSAASAQGHDELSFDTPTRNDFARLMTSIEHGNGHGESDDLFGDADAMAMSLSFAPGSGSEFLRPRSCQPVLSSTDHSHNLEHEHEHDHELGLGYGALQDLPLMDDHTHDHQDRDQDITNEDAVRNDAETPTPLHPYPQEQEESQEQSQQRIPTHCDDNNQNNGGDDDDDIMEIEMPHHQNNNDNDNNIEIGTGYEDAVQEAVEEHHVRSTHYMHAELFS